MVNGTTGVNKQVLNETTGVENKAGTGTNQNSGADFANALNDSLREQALQTVMTKMANPAGGMNGLGGLNAMNGGLNGLGGIQAMLGGMGGMGGIGGMSGLGGMDAMMGGMMPSMTAGMENALLSVAGTGDMSGAQLMLFMMMLMMQTGDGGGDMTPIMQMMAGMLSKASEDAGAGRENNMLMPIPEEPRGDIKRMIDVALKQVGYHERNGDGALGRGNHTKFGAWYGMDGQPWCAMFVSWAADQAGLLGNVVPKHAYTPTGAKAYMQKGLYAPRESGYTPREGDSIYFFSKAKGRIGHVGIVIGYDPETQRVYTVEGNTNNAVRIRHYDINSTYIHGYGRNGGTGFGTIPGSSTNGTGASTF